jgi:hypothetical protein
MREPNLSKLSYITGFIALAAILAVEGFGVARLGNPDLTGRASSPTIMNAAYSRAN